MSEALSYDKRNDEMSHERSHQDKVRRVWVKRAHGTPTTIMMGKDSIVDDLKTAVSNKFPNTLARFYDPSDLRISLLLPTQDRPQSSKFSKKKQGPPRTNADSAEDFNAGIADNYVTLEPDQNVWDLIDEYYGLSMSLSDALVVDVPAEIMEKSSDSVSVNYSRSDDRDYHKTDRGLIHPHRQLARQRSSQTNLFNPKPQYPQGTTSLKSNALETLSVSPKIPNGTSPNLHKRSQSSPSPASVSNPPQSRSNNSQAVLLLPKNFSLGEQQVLNRMSTDDTASPKHNVGDRMNVTSIGADHKNSENGESLTGKQLLTRLKTEEQSDTDSDAHISPTQHHHPQTPITPTETDASRSVTSLSGSKPEKTINTSTFEKVLPSISVLVVEDNSINQAILGAFLRKHKIHYQIAKNGQEAIDKWRSGGFHLVLMDIQLPVKSGIEATKEIRNLEKINRIGVFAQHELKIDNNPGSEELAEDQKLDLDVFRSPVIIVALTASSNSSVDKTNALTAGCNDFLTKPVNLVWLQNKITEWGCMQALIDFDGWKIKGSSSNGTSKKSKK